MIAALKQVKTAQGYLNNLPDDHIYPSLDLSVINQKSDEAYPKVFLMIDDGELARLPSERKQKNLNFVVIVVVKKIAENDDPQVMVESYIEDIERLIDSNDSLNNTVQDASVTGFTTDAGCASPEGIAILRIETERFTGFAS